MRVFVSWSGDRSRDIALALRDWLPLVLQYTKPFVSSEDIRKGNRWLVEISEELSITNHGIVCLFPENLSSEWLPFEAGALSKSVAATSVWTLLGGGLRPEEVTGPLAQFQHTSLEKNDIKRMLESVNDAGGERRLDERRLSAMFEALWPRLAPSVADIEGRPASGPVPPARSTDAMLGEPLDLSRATAKTLAHFTTEGRGGLAQLVQFFTRVFVQPTDDSRALQAFVERCRLHPWLRGSSVGWGGQGVDADNDRMLYDSIHLQSYRVPPRDLLHEIANEVGIEIVHIDYNAKRQQRDGAKPMRAPAADDETVKGSGVMKEMEDQT